MSQRPADPAPPPTAPEPSRTRPSIPFWLLKPLLGLVLAVVALLVMIQLVTSDHGTPAPAVAPSSSSTSVAPAGPATPGGAQAGTVTVGGVFLLPLSTSTDSAGSLAGRTGQVVQAQGVLVLSTPSADSAWVGTSADDRVYVRLVGSSAGAVPLSPGRRVAFTGTMVPNGDGLPSGDGAALLARQTQHVQVFPGAVSAA